MLTVQQSRNDVAQLLYTLIVHCILLAVVVHSTVCHYKALPIDLADNVDNARYVYLVTVFTGSRYGSGTTSKVYITIYGELLHVYYSWGSQNYAEFCAELANVIRTGRRALN